jgi:DtxR family Mn-dependent transcriptional regulator
MELSEKAEEILERMWVEINEKKNIPDLVLLKDDEGCKELIDHGCISLNSEKVLTARGGEEGKQCVRRHRLAERLLVDVLQIKAGAVHEPGCKLEHILHKGLEDNICTLLGHPKTCPHGRLIPAGKCCREQKRKSESLVLPLSQLRKGDKGKIAYIHTHDKPLLRKVMAMGALPGMSIKLIQKFPSYVFQIGESQFAVDKSIADQINVWRLK